MFTVSQPGLRSHKQENSSHFLWPFNTLVVCSFSIHISIFTYRSLKESYPKSESIQVPYVRHFYKPFLFTCQKEFKKSCTHTQIWNEENDRIDIFSKWLKVILSFFTRKYTFLKIFIITWSRNCIFLEFLYKSILITILHFCIQCNSFKNIIEVLLYQVWNCVLGWIRELKKQQEDEQSDR